MRTYGDDEVAAGLPFERLVPALREAFAAGTAAPDRHHHEVGDDATLLLMPAWSEAYTGVKIVHVHPRRRPAIAAAYVLSDVTTGATLAVLAAAELTRRRTAAASALAASYLARPDASTLLVCGTGQVGELLPDAYLSVRPIDRVLVWNRTPAGAERLVGRLRSGGRHATAVTDLDAAVATADVVSCATFADVPLVHGARLRPGTHVDLVGSYAPHLREADDDAVRRATVFVDTATALTESGDLTQPLASGALTRTDVAADLAALCAGRHPGRRTDDEITLFKSVGTAAEDLAAAVTLYEA